MSSVKNILYLPIDGYDPGIAEELQFCLYPEPFRGPSPLDGPVQCTRGLEDYARLLFLDQILSS
jgi:hypothetical protein